MDFRFIYNLFFYGLVFDIPKVNKNQQSRVGPQSSKSKIRNLNSKILPYRISFSFEAGTISAIISIAGDFDGSKPLLISVVKVVECVPDGYCSEKSPADLDMPKFLKVDFTNNIILPAPTPEGAKGTEIERREVVDGKLILQGAEDGYEKMRDGLGWTIAISEETGQVVLTASGDEVAFVVFGAALPM